MTAAHRVEHARAEGFLRSLPDASVGLILTDPPYFRVKNLAWDRAWSDADRFIAWLGGIADEWARVLKPNGTLVCFASSNASAAKGATLAARVECMLGERFNVTASAVWVKADAQGNGKHSVQDKSTKRTYFPQTERAIICESTSTIPMQLRSAREARGWTRADAARAMGCNSRLIGLWEDGERDPSTFRARILAEYSVDIGVRRPFDAEAGTHFTDVWTYPTVPARKGKHPCEKPADMARDLVLQCSRPGDVVLDTFCGSGVFLRAAAEHGRIAWGCDADEWWASKTRQAVGAMATAAAAAPVPSPAAPEPATAAQLDLFGAAS